MSSPSRTTVVFLLVSGLALAGLLWVVFRPVAVPVSLDEARQGHFAETLDEEGRARLPDPFVISAPVQGYLLRVEPQAGDRVMAGQTLFEIESLPAPTLDPRAREQAREAVSAAQARLMAAEAELESRASRSRLSMLEFDRVASLHARDLASTGELDRLRSERDAALAAERAAAHLVNMNRAELESARLQLEVADGQRTQSDLPRIAVRAPIDGVITRCLQRCEGPVDAGLPILEMGDLDSLEVRVDLLSADAVRVRPGMSVLLDRWGGERLLRAQVHRIEPYGFEKVSALGVEEQRVAVWLRILSPREEWTSLGDGYRVEARFILWEADDVLHAPGTALFRHGDGWAVYVVESGRARLRPVVPGRRGGLRVQILEGLVAGEQLIVYPGDRLSNGVRVRASS